MSLAHAHAEPDPIVFEARQNIASNVRAEMGRKRVTQTALARALNLSQPVVSRRVRGEIPFDTDELVTVAAFLGCELGDLLVNTRNRCFSPLSLVKDFEGQMELAFGEDRELALVP